MISQEDLHRRHGHSSSIYRAPLNMWLNWHIYITIFKWLLLYRLSPLQPLYERRIIVVVITIIPISILQGEKLRGPEKPSIFSVCLES